MLNNHLRIIALDEGLDVGMNIGYEGGNKVNCSSSNSAMEFFVLVVDKNINCIVKL